MQRSVTFFNRAVVVGLIVALAPTVASLWAQPVQGKRATPKDQSTVPSDPTAPQRGPIVLLDQRPNQIDGFFSDADCAICISGEQVVAENFNLDQDRSIGLVKIFGGYWPLDQPPIDAFTVHFYEDDAGFPGLIINSQTVPAIQTLTGLWVFGVREYQIEIEIVELSLSPGTYWVSVHNDTPHTDSFFWESGDLDPVHGKPGFAFRTDLPVPGDWFFDRDNDLAITLIPPDPCPWDIDGDGSVGASDLLSLLLSWGPCKGCPADFDGDGNVGASDLLALLANWGPCP